MKKSLLFVAGFAMAVLPVAAQRLVKDTYVVFPEASSLNTYLQQWNNGAGTLTIGGATWEDEEFFTSRVKPKQRFYETMSQVRPDLIQHTSMTAEGLTGTDHRYMNWIPVGDNGFNAIPNAKFDSETFTMWSYVDHWGNWTAPYGWAVGAFADAAHKNGVGVSGVASIPNASMPESWKTCLNSLISQGAEKLGKFLYYHGVDGIGYNSEWTSGLSPKGSGLTTLHEGLYSYMANASHQNPLFENIWYNGVTDTGGLSFDHVMTASTDGELIKGTSMFLNYNWVNRAHHTTSVSFMKDRGLDPYKLYAGMNQEGSSSDCGAHFNSIQDRQLGIGIWGAHVWNAFWRDHGQGGSTTEAIQRKYLNDTEAWYTGASRNPAVRLPLKSYNVPYTQSDFAGISALVSARSVLNWDLTKEPFYTFFNLGNGRFFNWKGERVSDTEWYNLGVQDYLPTWRFWFAPTLLANDIQASQVHMNAQFTWDDAYFGGSCLKVSGTSAKEYLHLFKCDFPTIAGDKIVLKYKLLGGKGKVSLFAAGMTSSSAKTYTERTYGVFDLDNCEAIEDASYAAGADGWQTAEISIKSGDRLSSGMRVLGIKFENAENLEMLVGGLWIEKKGASFATPAAPQIKSSRILANTYSGIDAKIIWTMDGDAGRKAGTPVYNSDVYTSMFKVYSQEQGGEPKFICATTSWAAIAFQCPNTGNDKPIRFGVSAVSMDTKSESAITWSAYQTKPSYTSSNEVAIDKTVIKPGESFSIYYIDPLHESSSWQLVNAKGQTVASATGVRMDVPNGLEFGGYDLYVDRGTSKENYIPFFVQVSGEGVGAIPEVYTLSHEGDVVTDASSAIEINPEDTPMLSYTGRKSDGSASRALSLNNHWVGTRIGDLGIINKESMSMGGWFKFNEIPEGKWNLFYISNKNDAWPIHEWGWSQFQGNADGELRLVFRGNFDGQTPGEVQYTFPNLRIRAGVWTHIMLVCEEASGDSFRALLYVNGVLQESTWRQCYQADQGSRYEGKTTLDYTTGMKFARSEDAYLLFGGTPHNGVAVDGICDDFQVWNVACTEAQVKQSMNGFTTSNYPTGMLACWNFENDANSDLFFKSFGAKSNVNLSTLDWIEVNGKKVIDPKEPTLVSGCPFLEGTAFPVVTEAIWKDEANRKTQFLELERSKSAGEEGSAVVSFTAPGDHYVTLTLQNSYGSDTKAFPVIKINDGVQGIEDVLAGETDFDSYTEGNLLFLEFGQDGDYTVEVYTTAGVLAAAQQFSAVVGQTASVSLGTPGVYLVKVSKDGKVLRTVKALSK